MGEIKRELDKEKEFLGFLTEDEFYQRLHYNREHGHNRGQK
jgi:hypothetical protein